MSLVLKKQLTLGWWKQSKILEALMAKAIQNYVFQGKIAKKLVKNQKKECFVVDAEVEKQVNDFVKEISSREC